MPSRREYPQDKQIVEPEDEKEYKPSRLRGCLHLLRPGRIIKFLVFSFILAVILLIVTIVYKPPVLWEPFKALMNYNVNPEVRTLDANLADTLVNLQLSASNNSALLLTEEQVLLLLRNQIQHQTEVDIQQNKLLLYVNLEQSGGNPLWLIVELNADEQKKPKVNAIGTGLVKVPGFMNDMATSGLNLVTGIDSSGNDSGVLGLILNNTRNVNITGVEFSENQAKIYIDTSSSLLNLIPSL